MSSDGGEIDDVTAKDINELKVPTLPVLAVSLIEDAMLCLNLLVLLEHIKLS